MTDKDLHLEKCIKNKQQEKTDALMDLYREIIKIKGELNEKIHESDNLIINSEILELSTKLDELVVEYFKNQI
ncbi:MAG: hypothetical protein WBJ13_02875 [Sedimentibacter sp.]